MSQHDYVIANGTGAAVRSDLNNALAAIVSNNSGATAPSTTYAYQWWADTTTGLLKLRNAANNAWVTIGSLSTAGFGLLAAGDTLTAALGSASTPGITFTGDLNTGIYSPGADQVAISTNGSGRLFVDSGGRVLVGTSSAIGSFQFAGSSRTSGCQIVGDTIDNGSFAVVRTTTGPVIYMGAGTSGTNVIADNALGYHSFHGYHTSAYYEGARITAQVDGTPGVGDMPGRLSFATSADGSASPTERLRITSAGLVGIGTTSPSATLQVSPSSGSANFQVSRGSKGLQINQDSDSADPNINTIGTTALKFLRDGSESMRIDTAGRLLVGTSSTSATCNALLQTGSGTGGTLILAYGNTSPGNGQDLGFISFNDSSHIYNSAIIRAARDGGTWTSGTSMPTRLTFSTTADGASSATERMRIRSDGSILLHKTTNDFGTPGTFIGAGGQFNFVVNADDVLNVNRLTDDGKLIRLFQASTEEGNISVSGTTVSYNGAHLSRWSQLPGIDPHDKDQRPEILRGTVMSNLDEMCDWIDPESGEAQDNEQLNKTKVSDVEGDKNVAGIFQSWDDDDDTWVNDYYLAMTGDFIIRIAAGVTVERGDLLMSAGDGTAKPQDDDLVRSCTIAKVTSTTVSCTYEDGSYCVPCVLMAC